MEWIAVERPGQQGFKKDEFTAKWNEKYGKENWRKAWHFNGQDIVDKIIIFQICEDAYYEDSFKRENIWQKLITEAKDIYDMSPEEIESGLDYSKQHEFTRYHDIAIRRVVAERGWKFQGNKIIQIRDDKEHSNEFSALFDPGRVPFHLLHLIYKPNLEGWWNKNSVEDFYQSNKILQARKSTS